MDRNNTSGILYVVATPIGNLEDITLRALRILKEADYILCEDKRVTLKLLNRHSIKTNLITLHKHIEYNKTSQVISLLNNGEDIALVSDAGNPLISDPGSKLISEASKNKIKIITIPGPSSITSALSICPIPFDNFLFIGFLPDKKNKRNELLSSLHTKSDLVVIFIAPHDLKKYTEEINFLYPNIKLFFARELTKIYEETWHGNIKEFIKYAETKKLKGEIVLCLDFSKDRTSNQKKDKATILKTIQTKLQAGSSLREASKEIGKTFNISSNSIYNMYIKSKRDKR